MKDVTEKQAEETLKAEASKVTAEDLEKVLKRQEDLERTFTSQGPLQKFVDDLKLLFGILRDYLQGRYKAVPFWSIAAIGGALLYVINPLDLIPDVLPVIGYVDDAAVVAACLKLIQKDLHAYRDWRLQNS